MALGCQRLVQSHLRHACSVLPRHCRALGQRVRPFVVARKHGAVTRRSGRSNAVRCFAQQPAASEGETFTVTTPLYYVNAGKRGQAPPPAAACVAAAGRQRMWLTLRARPLTACSPSHGQRIPHHCCGRHCALQGERGACARVVQQPATVAGVHCTLPGGCPVLGQRSAASATEEAPHHGASQQPHLHSACAASACAF